MMTQTGDVLNYIDEHVKCLVDLTNILNTSMAKFDISM
jgi:hypothetical protein